MPLADSVHEGSPIAAALAAVTAPEFLRKLDRLRLRVRHSLSTRPGNTPMPRGAQGSGLEIESHKTYAAGDDLRHLDWNVYGRLDQLLVKTFRAEREAPLHVFVDTSASMQFPAGDNKLEFAAALASSLTYVSVRNHGLMLPTEIAETYVHLAKQHRSTWTHELDLRAFSDRPWWNH